MRAWKWLGLAVSLLSAVPALAAEGGAQAAASATRDFKDPVAGIEMVFIKGGCYQMGDIFNDALLARPGDDEPRRDATPVHEVCVGDFFIGKYEVTKGQWKTVMGNDPASAAVCPEDDCPVDNVAWSEMQEFIRRLNGKAGGGTYRLPTEAEWEYAARSGGKNERYSGGNDVESVSWNEGTTRERVLNSPEVHRVGTRIPNGLGLHDMSGNVYEATSDWYDATYYASSPRDNPAGPESGTAHTKRGGCANGNPGNSRTARRREFNGPNPLTGFRLLRVP